MRTSASTNFGIDELFLKVGEKFLIPENLDNLNQTRETISLIQSDFLDENNNTKDNLNNKDNCC